MCYRRKLLEGLGFEFDEAKAEWMRWYAELAASTDEAMLGSGLSRDFYLYNWWGSACGASTPAGTCLGMHLAGRDCTGAHAFLVMHGMSRHEADWQEA